MSDTLKYFSERIPATFVYAGINVEREGLFTGTRGQQIAGRFTMIPAVPFPYAPEWQGLVATLEDALRLHKHPPGTLTGLDRYLHQRTGGMIGSLSHLIRGAAIEAILDGSEKITRKLLDAVDLDHAAQARPEELFEAMQPGAAVRAQPHLDALGLVVKQALGATGADSHGSSGPAVSPLRRTAPTLPA